MSKSRKSNLSHTSIDSELQEVLTQLKIEKIASKLQEKDIFTLDNLKSIRAEEVDSWRDLAVGYRIKLKKYLEKEACLRNV